MSRLKRLLRCCAPSPCNTQQTPVQACNPVAQHMHAAQQAETMTADNEAAIRSWLARIDETDQEIITEVLDKCYTDVDAREYFIRRADEVPQEKLKPD